MVVQGPFNRDRTSELHPAVTIQGFPIVQVCSCLSTRPCRANDASDEVCSWNPEGIGVKSQLTG